MNLLRARLLRTSPLEHSLRVPDTSIMPLLHTLERQRRDECRTHTGAILSWQDLDGIMSTAERLAVPAYRPVQDLGESSCAALLSFPISLASVTTVGQI